MKRKYLDYYLLIIWSIGGIRLNSPDTSVITIELFGHELQFSQVLDTFMLFSVLTLILSLPLKIVYLHMPCLLPDKLNICTITLAS